jgi:uncharacterized protein YukE
MGAERDPLDENPYASQTVVNTDAPWVGDGTPVDVDLDGLREFGQHMVTQQRDLLGRSMHLKHLTDMPSQAWNGAVLGEAAYVSSQLSANARELTNYLLNLARTLENIGSAAKTVADSYQSADGTSAASLNAVLFAFGDKSVPRPAGLPPGIGQTYAEALMAEGRTTEPLASAGSPDFGPSTETVISPYQTMQTSYSTDGQVMERVTTSVPGSGLTVVTTTVYGPDGKVASTKTERITSSYDAATNTQTTRTETTTNGARSGASETRTTYRDGEVAREETTTYSTGADGREQEGTTRTETVGTDGVRTETTTRPGQDGQPDVVTDHVVIGPETDGHRTAPEPIALDYDPFARGNG